jgi:hypothetical protein
MARTRAQPAEETSHGIKGAPKPLPSKSRSKQHLPKSATKRSKPEPDPDPHAEGEEEPAGGEAGESGDAAVDEPLQKKAKGEDGSAQTLSGAKVTGPAQDEKLKKLIDEYGAFPLDDTALKDPRKPTPETMLAHLINAILTSTRISHQTAGRTLSTVIEAGYADLNKLEKSSWEERTEVLTEGGYTHYREKTATQLDDLAQWLRDEHDGDLNNLLTAAKETAGDVSSEVRDKVREAIKEVKGLGAVALDIFCDTAQGLWHELAPFLDQRSGKACEQAGLPTDVKELYDMVGRDPIQMCRLASALTAIRLQGQIDEIADAGEKHEEGE